MTHWVLFVAPLVVAALVMALAFVGCFLDSIGEGPPELYKNDVLDHPNLVSYWRLDEQSGTSAADSKDDNHGTYVGGVTLFQPSLLKLDVNPSALFDGTSGYVAVPRNDDSLNPPEFTVEAIVDITGETGDFRAVVSSRDIDAGGIAFGYILYASDMNKWEAWVGDGTGIMWHVVTGQDVELGAHFLVMTYDGTTLKLYVDPAEDAPAPGTVPYAPNPTRELRIGAGANEANPLYFFPGRIDEVAIYDTALDFSTIQTHFVTAWTGLMLGP